MCLPFVSNGLRSCSTSRSNELGGTVLQETVQTNEPHSGYHQQPSASSRRLTLIIQFNPLSLMFMFMSMVIADAYLSCEILYLILLLRCSILIVLRGASNRRCLALKERYQRKERPTCLPASTSKHRISGASFPHCMFPITLD